MKRCSLCQHGSHVAGNYFGAGDRTLSFNAYKVQLVLRAYVSAHVSVRMAELACQIYRVRLGLRYYCVSIHGKHVCLLVQTYHFLYQCVSGNVSVYARSRVNMCQATCQCVYHKVVNNREHIHLYESVCVCVI